MCNTFSFCVVCMYLCQSRLGPGAYQVTSYASAAHVLRGYTGLESACLSGQGCGLCIVLIQPNHWAASVAQWLEHLSGKQCVVGSNPTRAALFSVWVSCLYLFLFIEKSFHGTWFVPVRVCVWLHGHMVCAHSRVAWLHGFARWTATAATSWRDFVSEDTRTTCRYLDHVKMNVAQYRVWPDPRASTL